MPQDIHPAASDQPLRPPETDAASGIWRWLLAVGVVAVIVVGAYQAYRWLVSDVERRRAVAVETPAAPPAATMAPKLAPAESTPPPQAKAPAPAPATTPNEGPAPAVTGQAIHKCVVDGQVSYSNQPCPDGATSAPLQPDVAGADANGVTGSAGDSVPAVLVARPAGLSVGDPGAKGAVCGYLQAEIERLDFEFKQTLPPAVLDHISSQLASLRARQGEAKCAPAPQAADKKAPAAPKRPPARVMEEKREQ